LKSDFASTKPELIIRLDRERANIEGISAAVVGVMALVIGILLLMDYLTVISLPLKQSSNDNLSVSVPKSYTETKVGDSIEYTNPSAKSGEEPLVQISSLKFATAEERQAYLTTADLSLTKENITSGGVNGNKVTNVVIEKTIKDSNDIRIITGDIVDGAGKSIGKMRAVDIVGQKSESLVMIAAFNSDPGLIANMANITDSVKLK